MHCETNSPSISTARMYARGPICSNFSAPTATLFSSISARTAIPKVPFFKCVAILLIISVGACLLLPIFFCQISMTPFKSLVSLNMSV